MANLSPSVVRVAGAGRAYQSVAQSTAISIQDGTDYLRNVSTIAVTAIGVAMAQIAADEPQGQKLLTAAQGLVGKAVGDFSKIGAAATAIAKNYPSSFG